MANRPTLSVIIPNYNHAHYLPEALESILDQSYQPLEVIVIDDGSTDNSIQVIKSYCQKYPNLRLVENGVNRGVVFSGNRGFDLASGDYIYAASADDKVLPTFFEKSMQILSQHSEAGLCCSDHTSLDESTGVLRRYPLHISDQPCYFSASEFLEVVRRKNAFIAPQVIYKRSALLEAGKHIPELKWNSDFFTLYVIAFRYGVCYVPEYLTIFRVLSESFSGQSNKQRSLVHQVVEHMLQLLMTPNYSDVKPLFERSGCLSICRGTLPTILANPKYWSFLPNYHFRKVLWGSFKRLFRSLLPVTVVRAYHAHESVSKDKKFSKNMQT